MGQSCDPQKCVWNAYIIKSELFGTRPAEPWSWESLRTKSVNSLCFTRFPAHHYHHSATGLHRSDSEVADIYTGCRVSAAPLCSGLRVTSRATAKTKRKVMKTIPTRGTTAPSQALGGRSQVTHIYTGCRMSRSPLRSGLLGRRRSD